LALVSEEEKVGVLKFYRIQDAKLSLGSHLLKRYGISRFCHIPWREANITRDPHGKPIFRDAQGNAPLHFNVSHQAGLVAYVAVHEYPPDRGPLDIGVDVVCTSERRDRARETVLAEGWTKWVDVYQEILSEREAYYLKYRVLAAVPGLKPGSSAEEIVDFKLRAFYALWCLREAYVKMTGEALLAEWLKELEFREFRPPPEGDGGVVDQHEIWFRGERVDDVKMSLRSWGTDYMTCTALRTPERKEDGLSFPLGPFVTIDLDEILEFGEEQVRSQG
jgi:4'-phosphopantetheinyl transferase